MNQQNKNNRICKNEHAFYKSSNCLTCPICEAERKPKDGFLSLISAPARRALENNNVNTLLQLSKYSEKEILKFHGLGKTSIPILNNSLKEVGLSFTNK